MGGVIRIGTRESLLAVAQAQMLKLYIEKNHPKYQAVLVKMKTTGDRILDRSLEAVGGKGLFVKELDASLLEGRTDLSVHSLKDLPMEVSPKLPVFGYSKREDPQDALVLPYGCKQLDLSRPFGTSSPRRRIQLEQVYPGCQVQPVRGNVLTRLKKLDQGEYGALVLAAAGLKRLGLAERISSLLPVSQMVPAAGQGILAVQGRRDFDQSLLEGFFDEDAQWQALAERSFVRALGGGCASPTAAYARLEQGELTLTGLAALEGGSGVRRMTLSGPKQEAEQLGLRLAEAFKQSKLSI